MLDTFTRETFDPLRNTTFRLSRPDGEPLDLRLIETAGGEEGGGRNSYSFSLVFGGPPAPFLPQRIYGLSHDRLGAFDLFLVPIAREADGFRYEAVFNREKK